MALSVFLDNPASLIQLTVYFLNLFTRQHILKLSAFRLGGQECYSFAQ